MTNIDLDVLRTFVAGVDLGSFAKASSMVGRSQSAVSAQLRKLEDQVGQPLLIKRGRGLALTETGEIVLGYARRLLDLNDEVIARVRASEMCGLVRLGLPQDFAEMWLPPVLGRFSRLHPDVRIEVRCDCGDILRAGVASGDLDLALTWSDLKSRSGELLAAIPMAWIGPIRENSALPRSEPLSIVAFQPPCCFRAIGLAALDADGLPWRLAFTSPSLAGLWAAVSAGLGIAMRTCVGLPSGVRILDPTTSGLPTLPSIALDLHCSDAVPSAATSLLAKILKEAIIEKLASLPGSEIERGFSPRPLPTPSTGTARRAPRAG